MTRVLVLATSRRTRGGITAVLKLYEQSPMWRRYRCRWLATHRDGGLARKFFYLAWGLTQYLALLPFYDIVHIHLGLRPSAMRKYPFFRLAKLFGKKTVVHLHLGTQVDQVWNPRYQTMFRQCDAAILLSESIRQSVANHIGLADKLHVVYNPCPTVGSTATGKAGSPASYPKQNIILFAGTLYEGKGYRDLIRAFALIAPRHPDWRLMLAGNGEVQQARNLTVRLGIEGQVDLPGWVSGEQKHRAYCQASALCLPSYAEGFPMAVLDAWAYGLPVVATPVGGIPDVARDGDNMLLFNPGDVNTLATKLEMIITDPSLRQKLSSASALMASSRFSLNTITHQMVLIYDSIKPQQTDLH